ncbi:MAG: hypothetical protein ACK518_00340 [bacterium]
MASRKSASSLEVKSGDDINHGDFPTQIYWGNVAKFAALHLGAIYGLKLCFTDAKWTTLAWGKC